MSEAYRCDECRKLFPGQPAGVLRAADTKGSGSIRTSIGGVDYQVSVYGPEERLREGPSLFPVGEFCLDRRELCRECALKRMAALTADIVLGLRRAKDVKEKETGE